MNSYKMIFTYFIFILIIFEPSTTVYLHDKNTGNIFIKFKNPDEETCSLIEKFNSIAAKSGKFSQISQEVSKTLFKKSNFTSPPKFYPSKNLESQTVIFENFPLQNEFSNLSDSNFETNTSKQDRSHYHYVSESKKSGNLSQIFKRNAFQENLGLITKYSNHVIFKRALQPSHEKSKPDKWHDKIMISQQEKEQMASLAKLINYIVKQHLERTVLIILYEQELYSSHKSFFTNFLIRLPTTLMFGAFKNETTVNNELFLETKTIGARSFVLLLMDIFDIKSALPSLSKEKVVVFTWSSQWRIREFLTSAASHKYINLLIIGHSINKHPETYVLYTHRLYVDALGSSLPYLLTSWFKGKIVQKDIELFPNKLQNGFSGHRFSVLLSEQPPYVVKIVKRHGLDETVSYDGIEIRLLEIISKKLNFSLEYKEVFNRTLGPGDSVLTELKKGNAEVGVAGIYYTETRAFDFDMSQSHSKDCAVFLTAAATALPKNFTISTHLFSFFFLPAVITDDPDTIVQRKLRWVSRGGYRYRAILGPFHWSVWLCLIFTYMFAIIPLSFSDRHTLRHLWENPGEIENMFWYVFGTFTNCFTFTGEKSWTKSEKITTKILVGWYWVFSIIITACYTGSIIAFITIPAFPENINTVNELLEGFFRITTLDYGGWETWFQNSSEPIVKKLLKHLEYVSTVKDGLQNVTDSFFWDYAFLGSKELLQYIMKTNYTAPPGKRDEFHISDQCFVPFFVSMAFTKQSIYKEHLDDIIMRSQQAGLIIKINNDFRWSRYRTFTGTRLSVNPKPFVSLTAEERALSLDDVQGMFLLLGIGFTLGAMSLVSEQVGGCFTYLKANNYFMKIVKIPGSRTKTGSQRSLMSNKNVDDEGGRFEKEEDTFNVDIDPNSESQTEHKNGIDPFGDIQETTSEKGSDTKMRQRHTESGKTIRRQSEIGNKTYLVTHPRAGTSMVSTAAEKWYHKTQKSKDGATDSKNCKKPKNTRDVGKVFDEKEDGGECSYVVKNGEKISKKIPDAEKIFDDNTTTNGTNGGKCTKVGKNGEGLSKKIKSVDDFFGGKDDIHKGSETWDKIENGDRLHKKIVGDDAEMPPNYGYFD